MSDKRCGGIDMGNQPAAVDLARMTKSNCNFRAALWTGENLQVTLMCIPVGECIGAEVHCDTDQMLYVESGSALCVTGTCRDGMNCRRRIDCGCAAIIPAGTWHNLVNIGNTPLKVFSVYAPPQHPFGTVSRTKRDALCGRN